MSHRARWILLALITVLAGGVAVLVLTQQPKLDGARSKVDDAWKALRAPDQLPLRYRNLAGALSAFDAAGGKDRAVSKDLHAALDRWDSARRGDDAGTQASAANAVEAQGTRLVTNVLGSQRIKADKAVTDALTRFATTTPSATAVDAYNRAVRDYEDQRTDALTRPVAWVLGFGARPVLELGAGAGASAGG